MPKKKKVGYGKPPKKTQFKPGQSGNPAGRPKGTKNLKTDLAEELAETIPVKENGKSKKISKQRAMLKALSAKAMKGDIRAIATLLNLRLKVLGEDPMDIDTDELSAADQDILKRYEQKILANKQL